MTILYENLRWTWDPHLKMIDKLRNLYILLQDKEKNCKADYLYFILEVTQTEVFSLSTFKLSQHSNLLRQTLKIEMLNLRLGFFVWVVKARLFTSPVSLRSFSCLLFRQVEVLSKERVRASLQLIETSSMTRDKTHTHNPWTSSSSSSWSTNKKG